MAFVSLGFFVARSVFLLQILPGICSDPFGNRNFGSGNQDAIEEHDLLQAIRVPFDDPRTQYFDSGLDGFPAYGIREAADIKAHYRLFLPDRLYRDFALLATVKPDRRDISYLFAVVNPLDTLVQFGIKISPSLTSSQNVISLLYTDHSSHLVTQTLTSFEVPLMTKKWNRFALKVVGDNITLYLNCKFHASQMAMRNPKELTFDTASTLYIGQAGPILKGNFQGAIQDLKLYGMPGVAEVQCDDSFSQNFSSGESSGESDSNQLNDWSDVTYDYSEGEDYEDEELGSSAPMPPIPPPPPSPSGPDFTALRNLATSLKTTSKGEKGEIGPRGPAGPSGQKGEPGKSFPFLRESGSGSGDEFIPFDPGSPYGKCTCNYTELFTKLPDSFRGSDGKAGSPGPPGLPGPQGEVGPSGKKGEIGYQGPKGDKGSTGEKGERGLPGLSMTPSAVGYDPDWRPRNLMKEHLVAKPGPKGEVGEVGPRGPSGERGERGLQGLPGEKGDKGAAGVNGLPGIAGKEGKKGEIGPVGPAGPPGPEAAPSNLLDLPVKEPIKGEKGDIGLPGRRGRRGKAGPPGPPGEIGVPGWPPGGKHLGRPGASITGQKGDKGEAVGDFYKYEIQGPPSQCPTNCPSGPPGPQGPPGVPGISIVGEPGMGIPGPMGPKGERGDASQSSNSKVVPGAVLFLSREAMIRMSESSSIGTIAFVREDEQLFVRVSGGWRPILTGELLLAPVQHTGHFEGPTPEPARLMRPFEPSSLVNSNAVEGPSLRMAALNDPWSGDMHGIRGSDYSCYRQARNANLVGTFRAFLVSYVQNLDSIVKYSDRNLPVLNTKGEVLFNSWSEIFQGDGPFFARPPALYSFSGRNVMHDFHWPTKKIWHGSASGGQRAKTAYCEAWHSDSPSSMGLASDLLKGQIMGQETLGCNHKLIVLCIEIASQGNSRRRRRSVVPLSPTSSFPKYSSLNDTLLRNLTLDQYSRLIENYDKDLQQYDQFGDDEE